MAEKMHRTQILLEPDQHKALAELATREGRSISEIAREMIGRQLEQRKLVADEVREQRLEALERIKQHREEILAERGGEYIDFDVVEAINQMREERDAENWAILTGSGD